MIYKATIYKKIAKSRRFSTFYVLLTNFWKGQRGLKKGPLIFVSPYTLKNLISQMKLKCSGFRNSLFQKFILEIIFSSFAFQCKTIFKK